MSERRLGIFVTSDELAEVKTAQDCSGMCLSGGIPMGDPAAKVAYLINKYNLPDTTALDIRNGEFVSVGE